MKAILIDVRSKMIKYVEVQKDKDGSYLPSIYALIDCRLIQGVNLDAKHTLYVDEEGLLKLENFFIDKEGNLDSNSHFFVFDGYPQPLIGNGLIIAYNKEGDKEPIELTLEEIAEKVLFTNLNTLKSL